MALPFVLVIYTPGISDSFLATCLFIGGFCGGGQMLTFAMAKEGYPNAVAATVVAIVNMVGIGGALIFQPLFGYMAQINDSNFERAMILIPVCLILGAILALFVKEKRHPDHISGG